MSTADCFESLQLIASVPFNAAIMRTGGCSVLFAYVPLPPVPLKRAGRPRLYKSSADRQSEYRKRKQRKKEAATPAQLDSMSRGQFMLDAPHGCGQLVNGGYDSGQIARVSDASERDENGRRHRPKGQGAAGQAIARDEDGADTIVEVDNREREDTFVLKQARAFERPSKPLLKKQFKRSVRKLFCPMHSIVAEGTAGAFRDGDQWALMFEVRPGPNGTWKLACGCCRKSDLLDIVTPPPDNPVTKEAA
jgi:hypothetical protein